MNRNEHQKDGGRKRYRLFVFVMVIVMIFMICFPWRYKGGADKEAVAVSYNPNPLGVWNKIADGVTTNIAMHGGTSAPEEWYNYYAQSRIPVNFGASFFYTESRNRYRLGRYDSALPGHNVPVYFHARYSDMEEPGTNLDAVSEIIRYARKTGAAVHIDHINSTGGTFSMKKSLAMISAARKKGMDITSCVYPYD